MYARTVALTSAAMLAFAANSLLCRLALGQGLIDAASFTTVRIASGALLLALIVVPRRRAQAEPSWHRSADWRAFAALFAYMACFSFSYRSLSAGTGALVLFGAVQLTMFAVALKGGERFRARSWVGLLLAFAGLAYLVSPGLEAPDPIGAALMAGAGIAWGFYSLLGRGAGDPLERTAASFVYAVPPALLLSLVFAGDFHASASGIALAISSGALASALGYAIWYAALKHLSATRAATVQLSVPVIAAFGGVLLLAEPVTLRLVLSSAVVLGGVALALWSRAPSADPEPDRLRPATRADVPALARLIRLSAHGLSREHYTFEQVESALHGLFGVDTQLIDDGTYFVIERDGEAVACGGWSYRATLFGSDEVPERDPRRLDPTTEAARIRAFFVHPEHARRGLGRLILEHCERAARAAGFTRLELGATLPGLPFYRALGYREGTPQDYGMGDGTSLRVVPMSKSLPPNDANA